MGESDTSDDDRRPPAAQPGVYRGGEAAGSGPTFTLDVDGEQFAVRVSKRPATGYTDTSYTWLSGPNKGYGFCVGGPSSPSPEEHRARIQEFQADVDPSTGYLEED